MKKMLKTVFIIAIVALTAQMLGESTSRFSFRALTENFNALTEKANKLKDDFIKFVSDEKNDPDTLNNTAERTAENNELDRLNKLAENLERQSNKFNKLGTITSDKEKELDTLVSHEKEKLDRLSEQADELERQSQQFYKKPNQ